MGPGSYDSVAWRPVLDNEIDAVKAYIPEIGTLEGYSKLET